MNWNDFLVNIDWADLLMRFATIAGAIAGITAGWNWRKKSREKRK